MRLKRHQCDSTSLTHTNLVYTLRLWRNLPIDQRCRLLSDVNPTALWSKIADAGSKLAASPSLRFSHPHPILVRPPEADPVFPTPALSTLYMADAPSRIPGQSASHPLEQLGARTMGSGSQMHLRYCIAPPEASQGYAPLLDTPPPRLCPYDSLTGQAAGSQVHLTHYMGADITAPLYRPRTPAHTHPSQVHGECYAALLDARDALALTISDLPRPSHRLQNQAPIQLLPRSLPVQTTPAPAQ
ncbi:hypothetical protein B0H14DRAFT_3759117 [Mycena olivaceomarginata]|nr:hypothetical protein B0H14DRAFT_3759117 [Mycena olivaceomarginata]